MRVGVIGGTGYSGAELIKCLVHHPHAELAVIASQSKAETDIQEIYPHLTDICKFKLEDLQPDILAEKVDTMFFAAPSGASSSLVPQFLERGIRCIDLAGDFRLSEPEVYEKWYQHNSPEKEYLENAVYGLSEIYPQKIKTARLIANPGCYPTAALLGLIPAVQAGLIKGNSIIIDGKSGISGAGRSLSLGVHYSEANENTKAYKLGVHQHIPEIEQVLNAEAADRATVTFTAHLVPMVRGILCTIYADMKKPCITEELQKLYEEFYNEHPFVRIKKAGRLPATKEVSGSNYCDIGLHCDPRTNRITIVAAIDNLLKGAAGQAVQNMNLMNRWDTASGLQFVPNYP